MKHSSLKKINLWKLIGQILVISIYAFIFALGAWMLISWIDIIADNCRPNPSHFEWNFFTVMIEWTEPWRS